MKTEILKKLIKEAVKEAIQDELKDILLEAIKTPKTQVVRESIQPTISMTSKDASSFNPRGVDPINGNLGDGEVKMDTIMGLLNTK